MPEPGALFPSFAGCHSVPGSPLRLTDVLDLDHRPHGSTAFPSGPGIDWRVCPEQPAPSTASPDRPAPGEQQNTGQGVGAISDRESLRMAERLEPQLPADV